MTVAVRVWDDFEAEAADPSGSTGATRLTLDAHAWALSRAAEQFRTGSWEYAAGGSRFRILTPYGYVAEVRGQSSATAHGMQGADPAQIAEARELELPVLMMFKDHGKVQAVWLDDPHAPIVNIDRDTAHRRQGWRVADMTRSSADGFRFPEEVPHFDPGGLF